MEDPFLSAPHPKHPPTQSDPHWQRAAPRLSCLLLLFITLGRLHTYRPPGFSLYALTTHAQIYIYTLFVLHFIPSNPFFAIFD